MKIDKSRTFEELWRFKRPQKTYKWEEFCSQVLRQVIWSRRLKTTENQRIWARERCHAPSTWTVCL